MQYSNHAVQQPCSRWCDPARRSAVRDSKQEVREKRWCQRYDQPYARERRKGIFAGEKNLGLLRVGVRVQSNHISITKKQGSILARNHVPDDSWWGHTTLRSIVWSAVCGLLYGLQSALYCMVCSLRSAVCQRYRTYPCQCEAANHVVHMYCVQNGQRPTG